MAMIMNDWLPAIQGEFKKPYLQGTISICKRRIQQVGHLSAGR